MSGIANLAASHASVASRQGGSGQKPTADAQAVAVAEHAVSQAQGRVDADRRAHSPSCVALDQEDVDKASAELAHVQAAEAAAPAGSQALSITA